jgi:hypothetical protein
MCIYRYFISFAYIPYIKILEIEQVLASLLELHSHMFTVRDVMLRGFILITHSFITYLREKYVIRNNN